MPFKFKDDDDDDSIYFPENRNNNVSFDLEADYEPGEDPIKITLKNEGRRLLVKNNSAHPPENYVEAQITFSGDTLRIEEKTRLGPRHARTYLIDTYKHQLSKPLDEIKKALSN